MHCSFTFSAILYTLAKQAKELNYKKLNLQVNNRIQSLRVPQNLREQVDVCLNFDPSSECYHNLSQIFLSDQLYCK